MLPLRVTKATMLLPVALLWFMAVSAQNRWENVIYLKNDSVVRGLIIEEIGNDSIRIKKWITESVFSRADIERIEWKMAEGGGGTTDYGFRPKGFAGHYEFGLSARPNGGNVAAFYITVVNGYRFNPYFSAGLGVGAEISKKSPFSYPVFADLRAYIAKTRLAPFVNVCTGYNPLVHKYEDSSDNSGTEVYHGFLFTVAFGVRYAFNQKVAMTLAVGYKHIDYSHGPDAPKMQGITLRWGMAL